MFCTESCLFSVELLLPFLNRARLFLIINIIHRHVYYNSHKRQGKESGASFSQERASLLMPWEGMADDFSLRLHTRSKSSSPFLSSNEETDATVAAQNLCESLTRTFYYCYE